MTDPLQSILQAFPLSATLFSPSSRYNGIESAKLETPDGEEIIYLRRRFVPPPERFALLEEHVVTQGDRLDNIAVQHLGDPELFWRICDANRALRPDELMEPDQIGRRLRITLPEGLQAAANG
jgi:nucleoid-associated protein YgaU